MKVFCELDPRDQRRIALYFPYHEELKNTLKRELNARFVGREKSPSGKPFWTVALDLETAKRTREIVEQWGATLELGRGIEAWGRDEVKAQRQLRSISRGSDAQLEQV